MFCRHRFDPVVAAALFKASSSPNYIQTNWQQGFGAFWKKFPHMFVRWKLQAVRVSVWPGDVLWKKETSSLLATCTQHFTYVFLVGSAWSSVALIWTPPLLHKTIVTAGCLSVLPSMSSVA
jgi:hypothetical protein